MYHLRHPESYFFSFSSFVINSLSTIHPFNQIVIFLFWSIDWFLFSFIKYLEKGETSKRTRIQVPGECLAQKRKKENWNCSLLFEHFQTILLHIYGCCRKCKHFAYVNTWIFDVTKIFVSFFYLCYVSYCGLSPVL